MADNRETKIITLGTKLPQEYPKEHLEHIPGVSTLKPKMDQKVKQVTFNT